MNNEIEEDNKNVEIIALEYDEGYEPLTTSLAGFNSSVSSVKGKYYRQTYRPAWESMPDFKGWLRGVHGQPTRAFCIYCQKTLHAHRLSLLKHTCTIRHQKAAQVYEFRKNRGNQNTEASSSQQDMEGINDAAAVAMVEYGEEADNEIEPEEADLEQEEDEDDEEEAEAEEEPIQVEYSKIGNATRNVTNKPPIATMVIDTSRGQPVCGLQVSLYKLIDGRWTYINEGLTGNDGKFSNFMSRPDFAPGRYKLHYDVDRYFESKKISTMYPFIEIVFDCGSKNFDYNVPVLLSPYGYSTYRG